MRKLQKNNYSKLQFGCLRLKLGSIFYSYFVVCAFSPCTSLSFVLIIIGDSHSVPVTGVGLGTLLATTVNVLWNRQLHLRSSINKEVCELRLLRRAIFGCFGTAQHSRRRAIALGLILSYTQTIISETQIESVERLEEVQRGGGISMNELDGTSVISFCEVSNLF